jgi:hypothetical protein
MAAPKLKSSPKKNKKKRGIRVGERIFIGRDQTLGLILTIHPNPNL